MKGSVQNVAQGVAKDVAKDVTQGALGAAEDGGVDVLVVDCGRLSGLPRGRGLNGRY